MHQLMPYALDCIQMSGETVYCVRVCYPGKLHYEQPFESWINRIDENRRSSTFYNGLLSPRVALILPSNYILRKTFTGRKVFSVLAVVLTNLFKYIYRDVSQQVFACEDKDFSSWLKEAGSELALLLLPSRTRRPHSRELLSSFPG